MVRKISGVYAYNTAYMRLLMKLKAQFQPNRAFDVVAVVDARRKAPVIAVEELRAPFRPKPGSSTSIPPSRQPGMPMTAIINEFRYVMYVDPSPNSAPRDC